MKVTNVSKATALYDEEAGALIGGALLYPDRLEAVAAELVPGHFYRVAHQTVWQAVGELVGQGVRRLDHVLVSDRCRLIDPCFSEGLLPVLLADAIAPLSEHAEIVLRHAAARKATTLAGELQQAIACGADPYLAAGATAKALDEVGAAPGNEPEALTRAELLARADDTAPWVVPDLLRLDWRCIVVAAEGKGKSTLLRQFGVCAAQGIHPLRFSTIAPVRVLLLDAENSRAAIAETGAKLDAQARRSAGERYDPERLRIWCRPGGIDLRDPRHHGELVRELRVQRPQLVVAGPVYKLGRRRQGESYEDAAEGVQQVLGRYTPAFGFALVLEHHAPKGEVGSREMSPFGSQRWLAWPELGLGLYAERDGTGLSVGRFRGDRMAASWPDKLARDEIWPFVGVWSRGLRKAG